jgi:hypothetical protein
VSRLGVLLLTTGAALAASGAAEARTRYPAGARHSPVTASVREHLAGVIARGGGRPGVFAKIGDSITAASSFLSCFAQADEIKLGEQASLAPSLAFFSQTQADASSPSWSRKSRSAHIGWSTLGAIGSRTSSPLLAEYRAIRPAFALVMYGTNETYGGGLHNFERNLRTVTRMSVDAGVVPLLSTIPPRTDAAGVGGLVPAMNEVVRLVGQAEQVPVMDYALALSALPDHGLGPDGIHPRHFEDHPCWLTPTGLEAGMNVRNLLSLEALDRMRRLVLQAEGDEPEPAALEGLGTLASPLLVDALPFIDDGETTGPGAVDHYACGRGALAGPEVFYAVRVAEPSRLRVELFSDDQLVVRALASPSADACSGGGVRAVELDVSAGTTLIAIDGRAPRGAPYRVLITGQPRRP